MVEAMVNLVLIDQTRCIACAMCAIVCPFDAVTFHPVAGNGNGHGVFSRLRDSFGGR